MLEEKNGAIEAAQLMKRMIVRRVVKRILDGGRICMFSSKDLEARGLPKIITEYFFDDARGADFRQQHTDIIRDGNLKLVRGEAVLDFLSMARREIYSPTKAQQAKEKARSGLFEFLRQIA